MRTLLSANYDFAGIPTHRTDTVHNIYIIHIWGHKYGMDGGHEQRAASNIDDGVSCTYYKQEAPRTYLLELIRIIRISQIIF